MTVQGFELPAPLLDKDIVEVIESRRQSTAFLGIVFFIRHADDAVDNRVLAALQATRKEVADRQDKISLEGYRVIVIRIVVVNVHRIKMRWTIRGNTDYFAGEP